jgi:hypothetical protein
MAFSVFAPLPWTLSENSLEGSIECGLIGEAAPACNFSERQPRRQQERLYSVYPKFHKPAVRRPPESPAKGMGKMAHR